MTKRAGGEALDQELAAFVRANPVRRGPSCTTCALAPEYRALLDRHIRERTATVSQVFRFLRSRGLQVSLHGMQRHVRDGHEAA